MKVLVVDPDDTLLPEVHHTLSSCPGVEVYSAKDGEIALQHVQALGGIDLLITDAFLPGMDGFSLSAAIREICPPVRTLFLTVYDLSSYAHVLQDSLVLHRPADPLHLLAVLQPSFEAHPNLPEPLSEGKNLGTFHLLRDAGNKGWVFQFAAVQIGLNRSALITVLDAKEALNPAVRDAFLADASAKARVLHPTVLAVYEAGEADGWTYYASERLEAPNLQMLSDRGDKLSVPIVFRIARSISEVIQYLESAATPHRPLCPADILLTADGLPRVLNPATAATEPQTPAASDLGLLGRTLLTLLPEDAPQNLKATLERSQPDHPDRFNGWDTFLDALTLAEGEQEEEQAGTPAPTSTTKTTLATSGIVLVVLVLLSCAGFLITKRGASEKPSLPVSVAIPAGRYLMGKGTPTSLPEFWIDRTEISTAQYARFLIWITTHPEQAAQFNHPEQPAQVSHTPDGWDNTLTEQVKEKGSQASAPQLNLPVSGVSWWDAFAFAKWAGRELPSQEEWEAAARGSKGLLFPWGDEADFLQATVKAGASGPAVKPADVATQPDVSPFGVQGMAGNVAEWTASRPKENQAIVKGGHFAAPLLKLDSAQLVELATRKPHLGFRTISHTPPKP